MFWHALPAVKPRLSYLFDPVVVHRFPWLDDQHPTWDVTRDKGSDPG
jgi:hypothetical protein